MKAAIALAFFLPFIAPKQGQDGWQAFSATTANLRFEMPGKPIAQEFESPGGKSILTFACQRGDIVMEAIAMEMDDDLKMAIHEAVLDSEVTVSRQVLDGSVEGFLEQLKSKPFRSEYARFQKCVSRTSWVSLPNKREAKLVSVLGKHHAYLFIVSYPSSPESLSTVTRFYDSIRLE